MTVTGAPLCACEISVADAVTRTACSIAPTRSRTSAVARSPRADEYGVRRDGLETRRGHDDLIPARREVLERIHAFGIGPGFSCLGLLTDERHRRAGDTSAQRVDDRSGQCILRSRLLCSRDRG